MCTYIQNGVLRNGQQAQSVVNGFFFEAMKTVSGRGAHCDQNQFPAKMMVST